MAAHIGKGRRIGRFRRQRLAQPADAIDQGNAPADRAQFLGLGGDSGVAGTGRRFQRRNLAAEGVDLGAFGGGGGQFRLDRGQAGRKCGIGHQAGARRRHGRGGGRIVALLGRALIFKRAETFLQHALALAQRCQFAPQVFEIAVVSPFRRARQIGDTGFERLDLPVETADRRFERGQPGIAIAGGSRCGCGRRRGGDRRGDPVAIAVPDEGAGTDQHDGGHAVPKAAARTARRRRHGIGRRIEPGRRVFQRLVDHRHVAVGRGKGGVGRGCVRLGRRGLRRHVEIVALVGCARLVGTLGHLLLRCLFCRPFWGTSRADQIHQGGFRGLGRDQHPAEAEGDQGRGHRRREAVGRHAAEVDFRRKLGGKGNKGRRRAGREKQGPVKGTGFQPFDGIGRQVIHRHRVVKRHPFDGKAGLAQVAGQIPGERGAAGMHQPAALGR